MKRAIEELMYQILIDLIFRAVTWLAEWISAVPYP